MIARFCGAVMSRRHEDTVVELTLADAEQLHAVLGNSLERWKGATGLHHAYKDANIRTIQRWMRTLAAAIGEERLQEKSLRILARHRFDEGGP